MFNFGYQHSSVYLSFILGGMGAYLSLLSLCLAQGWILRKLTE